MPYQMDLTEQQWTNRLAKFYWLNLDIGIPAFEAIFSIKLK
jgi:hypothetical protein